MRYSIILPCKDEEGTVGECIRKARIAVPDSQIIVIDNNSKDKSAYVAKKAGAVVIREPIQGYGAALRKGFENAKGDYIIMCDSDGTYDLLEIKRFIRSVGSADIVIGNRFNKNMQNGAMKFTHKYFGNPVLSLMMRILFHVKIKDSHCGFRMIRRNSLDRLRLESDGMELASEMIIKASQQKMLMKEVDISYYPRQGISKLNSFNDGWKHLKMMLMYSPDYLFLIPGILLFLSGIASMTMLLFQKTMEIPFTAHFAIAGSLMAIMGFNITQLWMYAKTYKITIFDESDELVSRMHRHLDLEKSIFLGMILVVAGILMGLGVIMHWIPADLSRLGDFEKSVFALTMVVLGIQTVFSGFMLSILGTKRSSQQKRTSQKRSLHRLGRANGAK